MKQFLLSMNRTVVGALVFALLFNVSIYATKVDLEQRSKAKLEAVLQTLLQTTEEALTIWVGNELTTLRNYVGYRRQLVQMLEELGPVRGDLGKLMAAPSQTTMRQDLQILLTNKGYLGYFLLTPDLTTIAARTDNELSLKRLQPLIQQANVIERLATGEALFLHRLDSNRGSQQALLYTVQAVIGPQQQVLGYLLFELNPALQFSKMLHLGRFADSGETYAFNYQGDVLSRSRFMLDAERGVVAESSVSLAWQRSDKVMVKTEPLRLLHQGQQQGTNVEGYLDYQNRSVIGAWHWNESLQLGMATELSRQEAFHNLNETKVALAVSQILTNILLVLMTIANVRRQEQIRQMSLVDGLTGISNRKALEGQLERILNEVVRHQQPATIMMIDVDKFKPYNDQFGHPQGDVALTMIAQALRRAVPRSTDVVARYGGEEFAVVLPFTNAEQAKVVAENILAEIVGLQLVPSNLAVHDTVTVSVGSCTTDHTQPISPQQAIQFADAALYQAKANQGNCVRVHKSELQQIA